MHLGGVFFPGALFSSGRGPHLGPYLVTESTDIPCLGFVCEGLLLSGGGCGGGGDNDEDYNVHLPQC